MNDQDTYELLKLYSIPGIGSARLRKLLHVFKTPQAVLSAPVKRLITVPGIEHSTAKKIKQGVSSVFLQQQFKYIKEHEIQIISLWESTYPRLLKRIYDPPAVLFIQGKMQPCDTQALAVVGTREPTAYGRNITEYITRELVRNGFTILSGLARGVDTAAHKTALKYGGRTIAILGSGLDIMYPRENKQLALQIAQAGAVVSEFPLGTIPDPGNFPRRNRIVSGLSLGVLVTEAGNKSGALLTAYEALEQNREVFAIPGPVNVAQNYGTNRLIKEGAKLVQEAEDILQELGGEFSPKLAQPAAPPPDLDACEQQIYAALSDQPVHVDQLALTCQRSTSEILSTLLTLELMGVVKQMSGKMFIRS